MRDVKRETVRLIGVPTRFTRNRLAGRRPIWLACWGVFWIIVLWDIYLSLDSIDGNTWSEVMREASIGNPVLPWLLGAFLAHLFHFRDNLKPIFDHDASSTLMVFLTFGFAAIGIWGVKLTGWYIILVVILGMVAALLLWPKLRQAEWHW